MTIGHNGTLPADLWNPPPPSIQAVRNLLMQALDKALARLPIQQQTVSVAVRWDVDGWRVHIEEAPPSEPDDGGMPCLIDFDQYQGSIEFIRQDTAKTLAEDFMAQRFPGGCSPVDAEPEPAWEADWK